MLRAENSHLFALQTRPHGNTSLGEQLAVSIFAQSGLGDGCGARTDGGCGRRGGDARIDGIGRFGRGRRSVCRRRRDVRRTAAAAKAHGAGLLLEPVRRRRGAAVGDGQVRVLYCRRGDRVGELLGLGDDCCLGDSEEGQSTTFASLET